MDTVMVTWSLDVSIDSIEICVSSQVSCPFTSSEGWGLQDSSPGTQ